MEAFIAATPMFKSDMSVAAYWLRVRSGDKLLHSLEDQGEMTRALNSPGLETVERVGIDSFAGDKPLLAEVSEYQLLMDYPLRLDIPSDRLICVIPKGMRLDAEVISKLKNLRDAGYSIAYDGFPDLKDDIPVINISEYLIFDSSALRHETLVKAIVRFASRKKIIVSNVIEMEVFEKLSDFSNIIYSGDFYSQPITKGNSEISVLKVNAMNLLNQVNDEDFDLLETAKTIEQDPSLSISLLRFINNTRIGSMHKVESIRSAVAILGQREVRRWATVAISVQLAEDKPSELTRLSLLRAKFAENLATSFEMGIFAPLLFMTGLFSLLDVILQKTMQDAIKEIYVDDRVKVALVDRSGPLYEVFEFIYAYERGDWDKASISMIRNNIGINAVNAAFIDALTWYKNLLSSIE